MGYRILRIVRSNVPSEQKRDFFHAVAEDGRTICGIKTDAWQQPGAAVTCERCRNLCRSDAPGAWFYRYG